ncbi:addiction module antitoxin [Pandoraea terrae]|uniref:Addiction module antitoxin n=2 Tax=Pandoraea terrae TaxID=1537710 RepID=A0A5E4WKD7_9BURK|nr:addiction module antitoxin [Pandoraea terrae]
MISADLGQQLETYVTKLVESGRYGSKSEVLREGVRLIQTVRLNLTEPGRALGGALCLCALKRLS